jgi:hypothetical protein
MHRNNETYCAIETQENGIQINKELLTSEIGKDNAYHLVCI